MLLYACTSDLSISIPPAISSPSPRRSLPSSYEVCFASRASYLASSDSGMSYAFADSPFFGRVVTKGIVLFSLVKFAANAHRDNPTDFQLSEAIVFGFGNQKFATRQATADRARTSNALIATLRLRAILPAVLIAIIQNAAPPEVADADVAVGLHICFVEVHACAEFLTTGDLVFRFVVGSLGAFYGFIFRQIGFGNVVDLRLLPFLGHSAYESHKLFCSPFKMRGKTPCFHAVSLFNAKSRLPGSERIPNADLLADALSVLDRLRRSADRKSVV